MWTNGVPDDRPAYGWTQIKNKRQSAEEEDAMETQRQKYLEDKAWKIRKTGLEMVKEARSGHIGRLFPFAEIMAVLYFEK